MSGRFRDERGRFRARKRGEAMTPELEQERRKKIRVAEMIHAARKFRDEQGRFVEEMQVLDAGFREEETAEYGSIHVELESAYRLDGESGRLLLNEQFPGFAHWGVKARVAQA